MPDPTETPWPDWLANLTPEIRVREIVIAVAARHDRDEEGQHRLLAMDAAPLLLRLLDEARAAVPPWGAERPWRRGTDGRFPDGHKCPGCKGPVSEQCDCCADVCDCPPLAVPPADAVGLRDRISVALDESVDRCARCKVCDSQVDAVMAVVSAELAARAWAPPAEPATEPEPLPPLPAGDYGRMELPSYQSHTGWWTPGVLAGQSVMVCTDRDGNAVAEYIPGPASRFVRLPVPIVAAADDPWRLALTAGDDDEERYPDLHVPGCRDEDCDGECQDRAPF